MKRTSTSKFTAGNLAAALAITLTLAGCADQPATSSRQARTSTTPSSGSSRAARDDRGLIPTRDNRDSTLVAGNTVGGGNGPEYRVHTGSNLPQHYNRRAYTTDTQDPSFDYDQDDIRLQSTNNVADSLRSVPGVRVNGTR